MRKIYSISRTTLLLFLLILGVGPVWADIVIDLDLTVYSTYPSNYPTSSSKSSTPQTVTWGGYNFTINSTEDSKPYYSSSNGATTGGFLLFGKCKSSQAISIDFPAIENYKLTKVEMGTTSGGSTNVYVTVRSGTSVVSGGDSKQYATSTTLTWDLTSTSANTSYCLYFLGNNTSGRNVQVASLKLTYVSSGPTKLSAPANLSSSNVTTNGATLSWDAVEHASSYTVKIDDTEYPNATSPYSATGLSSNTTYNWTVKAVGDGTNYTTSDNADSKSFTTLAPATAHTVTFNVGTNGAFKDGEEFVNENQRVEASAGAGVALPEVVANSGYVFGGWSAADPATTTYVVVDANGKYHPSDNVTLNAYYKVIPATPTFGTAAGMVEAGTEVTISCTTVGATIYYTTNGDEPTASSTPYSSAIVLAAGQTIKAIAVKEDVSSSVASATYTIATHTARFSVNGNIDETKDCAVANGEAIVFPANPADIDDLKFQGWTKTQNYSNATDAPSDLCTSATMGTNDVTFYAVYANVEDGKDGDIITLDYKNVHSAYTTDGVDREMQKIDGFKYYGCMQGKESGATVASILQMRKTSNDMPTSWIYNSTEINFSKVVITYMSTNNKLCNVFFGSEANPTTGAVTCDGTADAAGTNTFTNANKAKYFRIENPKNGAIYISSIKIHTVSAPVCTNYCTKVRESITLTNPESGDYGFSTFCGSANYTVVGAKAYKAKVKDGELVLTELTGIIPAGNSDYENGVVIAGIPGETATIRYTSEEATADMTGNQLLGTLAVTPAADLKGNATYLMVFSKSNGGFVSYTGANVPAYKACLPYSDNAGAPMRMVFGRDNLPTNNVNVNVNDNQGTKVMIDGRLYILRDGKTYDSFGRLVK